MDGTSGRRAERLSLDTARMRMLGLVACATASEIGTNVVGIWPPITSVSAGPVLDHHLLAERFGQPRRHQAAGHVDVAAGGEGNQELDRTVRPILGVGGAGETKERKGGERGAEEAPAWRVSAMLFHGRTIL